MAVQQGNVMQIYMYINVTSALKLHTRYAVELHFHYDYYFGYVNLLSTQFVERVTRLNADNICSEIWVKKRAIKVIC